MAAFVVLPVPHHQRQIDLEPVAQHGQRVVAIPCYKILDAVLDAVPPVTRTGVEARTTARPNRLKTRVFIILSSHFARNYSVSARLSQIKSHKGKRPFDTTGGLHYTCVEPAAGKVVSGLSV